MKTLVDSETLQPIQMGEVRTLSDSKKVKVIGWVEPHKSSSSGKVYVEYIDTDWTMTYYPSVIGAKFID